LILIMVSLGMGWGLSQGYTGPKPRSFGPSVGYSGWATVAQPTTMRAQAPGPVPKETMMQFYNQSHRR